MNPYRERDYSLIALGYSSYKQYLASALWKSIRARVSGDCLRCGAKRRCVHHASYDLDTMRGERIDTLVPACTKCHRMAEHKAKHLDPMERLNSVTAMLMTAFTVPGKRRYRDKSAMTWVSARVLPASAPTKRMVKMRKDAKRIDAARPVFDPTPRLRPREAEAR